MRLYKKEGSTIQIISFPSERVNKGDYLVIADSSTGKGIIVQVVEIQYANIPGFLEELLRSCNDDYSIQGEDVDPFEMSNHIRYIQDAHLLICKIRAVYSNKGPVFASSLLPSRSRAKIKKISTERLFAQKKPNIKYLANLGETTEKNQLEVDIRALDGSLNIITGKKGTGKSHISKLLTLSLVSQGAPVVILDLNSEYTGLGQDSDGKPNRFHKQIHILTPGHNLKVTLKQLKLGVMTSILVNALNLPGTSAREFRRIWRFLEQNGNLTMQDLGSAIKSWKCNQHVRDALFSRYYTILGSGLFTDDPMQAISLEDSLKKSRVGGAVVIDLRDTSTIDRLIVVEYVLGKIVELLSRWKLKAIFLFAEEAHLYLRETYWDDIVTRMRHFGVFTTFITNQPDTIRENIYRQADNLFLFNFTNEHDLETISRASKVDAETIKSIAHDLPLHHCVVLGNIVNDFPIVVKVRKLDVYAKGHTRLFFSSKTNFREVIQQ
ncbi:MAG: ATP-binding protein [Candidatus Bathyarchaeota archaeon]|nr:MAG: ATP-binding protein [Candidatus Bathyarchaeota archaeon]